MQIRTPDQWRAKDAAHVIHPNTMLGLHEQNGGLMIQSAHGSTLIDIEGKEYLDGIGALWLTNVGYGRPELADAAAAQMKELPFWSLFWSYGHTKAVELAERLAQLAPPGLSHTFFTSGGSEANESSMKIARLYHVRRGQPDRTVILALDQAYHGVSYGAMSATGIAAVRTNFAPFLTDVTHVPTPHPYRAGPEAASTALEALEQQIRQIGPKRVAALMLEPIGGVGGLIDLPDEYIRGARALCDRYGILLIIDEVICGFGRTGTWFGIEHSGVIPDIISCAKGITSGYFPLGASIIHDRVYAVIKGEPTDYFNHGFTYSGHPVGCAVALANIDLIEREELGARAVAMGAYLRERLLARANPHIAQIRGKGLMLGVQLAQNPATRQDPIDPEAHKKVEAGCRAEGVLLRALLGYTIAISPPLVITEPELDRIVDVLDRNIRRVFTGG
ncbi:MAG TPA: aspartate aminotransferase family protein [Symbiobacteriaceae bacterium]|nr:aspartate aminotransferase family protein [Symbiobacteriaceae bacterium]